MEGFDDGLLKNQRVQFTSYARQLHVCGLTKRIHSPFLRTWHGPWSPLATAKCSKTHDTFVREIFSFLSFNYVLFFLWNLVVRLHPADRRIYKINSLFILL